MKRRKSKKDNFSKDSFVNENIMSSVIDKFAKALIGSPSVIGT
jgi:hypothetical protein